MAIVTEISRLETAAGKIKTKTAQLELDKANGSGKISATDKLDVQADASEIECWYCICQYPERLLSTKQYSKC